MENHDFLPGEYIGRAIAKGRLSHAYLLLGAEGSGRLGFALDLARRLFCESEEGCRRCPSCRSIDHGNHPGVTVYGPREGRSVIDIATVRELCERSFYARDHVFVAILDGADNLTVPAANAVLKTLEEPNGDFLLVLTATSAGALLPTIVSRCHRLYFPAVPQESEAAALDPGVLALARQPDFFRQNDVREWLTRGVPGGKNPRERVSELLATWICEARAEFESALGGELDRSLERVGRLLELDGALAAQVSAELVLEQALSVVRRG